MNKFVVQKDNDALKSINRTIRMKPEHFEKLMEISEQSGVSFNKVVNQCIAFALDNLDNLDDSIT